LEPRLGPPPQVEDDLDELGAARVVSERGGEG
jgi:hypothetical protein